MLTLEALVDLALLGRKIVLPSNIVAERKLVGCGFCGKFVERIWKELATAQTLVLLHGPSDVAYAVTKALVDLVHGEHWTSGLPRYESTTTIALLRRWNRREASLGWIKSGDFGSDEAGFLGLFKLSLVVGILRCKPDAVVLKALLFGFHIGHGRDNLCFVKLGVGASCEFCCFAVCLSLRIGGYGCGLCCSCICFLLLGGRQNRGKSRNKTRIESSDLLVGKAGLFQRLD